MTDNEIIKALDYCCGNIENNDEECNEDMCYQVALPESRDEGVRWCRQGLIKDALDLINRQKAKIESLKDRVNKRGLIAQVTIDNDKLKQIKNECLESVEYNIKEIQSEAIKEFAERLKEVGTKVEGGKGFEGVFVMANNLQIDNLVKEMTEDIENDDTKNSISTFNGDRGVR